MSLFQWNGSTLDPGSLGDESEDHPLVEAREITLTTTSHDLFEICLAALESYMAQVVGLRH